MRRLALAWRLLGRELRAGEIRVVALALVVAVSSVTAVGFFTDRIHQLLLQQANVLLGADLVIASDYPLSEQFARQAMTRGLRTAQTVSLLSMVQAGERSHLTAIKAVSAGYPLRGELRIAPRRFAPDHVAAHIPTRGEVWGDEGLLSDLRTGVGTLLGVGDTRLRLSAVITQEPDRGGDFFNIAPRLMMNLADLNATGLIQPTSRVQYRLLVAGDPAMLTLYRKSIEGRLARGERLETVEDARPVMRTALERAGQFLGLASMVSVMLAGVAMAMATRRFVVRHLNDVAILRTLGAVQWDIAALYGWQWAILGVSGSALGCLMGFVAQAALSRILGSLAAATLPPPSPMPLVAGMLVGLLAMAAFAVPPLLHLKEVPTLRVLRRELGEPPGRTRAAYLLGTSALALLVLWQAGQLRLGLIVLGGSAATIAALAGAAAGILAMLRRLRGRGGGVWRFGVANLTRRSRNSVVQVVAFGLGLLALLLLGVVRSDLLADWQASLPPNAPNRFVINIQPEQVESLQTFFKRHGFADTELFPMVRGRLTAINGNAVVPQDYQGQAKRLVEREFNLSWAVRLPSDNSIVAGHWWTGKDKGKNLLSVEQGLAETLGIHLHDTLTYDIAGDTFTGEVTSLRKVDWDSFQVNFFVVAAPGNLEHFPASDITSFYLPPGQEGILNQMVRAFPNLTVIDVGALMEQVRQVIRRVSLALEYVFGFTVLAGLMVLYAAIESSLDERLLESAVLRTLGAGRRQLLGAMAVEFAGIGLIAGLVAATGAAAAGDVLAEHLFHFTYHLDGALWLWGGAGGAVAVAVAGLWGTRGVVGRPPWQTLRELQET